MIVLFGLLAVLACIVASIILAIKRNQLWKKYLISGIGLFLLVFFFAATIDSTPNNQKEIASTADTTKDKANQQLENQRSEFKVWYNNLDQKINFYDGVWNNGWRKVMSDLSDGNIDNYTAYQKLKHISDLLEKCQYDFATMPELKELSKEHKELLQAASQKLSTAAYTRKDAVQAAMQFLDDPKPSKHQETLDNIKMSDTIALEAVANIAKVREDLNLPIPEKKK